MQWACSGGVYACSLCLQSFINWYWQNGLLFIELSAHLEVAWNQWGVWFINKPGGRGGVSMDLSMSWVGPERIWACPEPLNILRFWHWSIRVQSDHRTTDHYVHMVLSLASFPDQHSSCRLSLQSVTVKWSRIRAISYPDPAQKYRKGVWQHVIHCHVKAHCTVQANQVAAFKYVMLIENVLSHQWNSAYHGASLQGFWWNGASMVPVDKASDETQGFSWNGASMVPVDKALNGARGRMGGEEFCWSREGQ